MEKTAFDMVLRTASERIEASKAAVTAADLLAVPTSQGPSQMVNAMNLMNQARALVYPGNDALKSRGLSRDAFEQFARAVAAKSQGAKSLQWDRITPSVSGNAAATGIGGSLLGGGISGLLKLRRLPAVLAALAGGGLSAAIGGGAAYNKGKQIKSTAGLLGEYGVTTPKLLDQSKPLLFDVKSM